MNLLRHWDENSLMTEQTLTTLPIRLARRQFQQFQTHLDRIRIQIDIDWKKQTINEDNLEILLSMTQDFVETLIQCQEEQQESCLLHNSLLPLQEAATQKKKLLETEEKFKNLRQLPETALSYMPLPLANIKFLQQLTQTVELSTELMQQNPEDFKVLKLVVTSQQLLLWNIIQHISQLITLSKLGP